MWRKRLLEKLVALGAVKREGGLIDATFAEAPRQRGNREGNAEIRKGEVPEEWENFSFFVITARRMGRTMDYFKKNTKANRRQYKGR